MAASASHRGAYWQHVVLSRVAIGRYDLAMARSSNPGDDSHNHIEDLFDAADQAAQHPGRRLWLWLNGSAINRAFVNLHAAQVLLARYVPDDRVDAHLQSAMTRVRTTMPPTAERREYLERCCADPVLKRWVLEKALEWSYAATDAQYARLRSFRNILTAVSIAVLVVAVGLAGMGLLWPEALQLCFGPAADRVCPTGSASTGKDAIVIEILGAAGGALAAVLSVRRMQGTSTPHSVPLALALLKLPFGALTAILGLVLIHGRFVPGLTNLDTSGQILAYAIALGVAQHAVTALVDRKGHELLAGIPTKRSSSATAPGAAGQPATTR